MKNIKDIPAWRNLESHFAEVKDIRMRDKFENDSERFKKFSIKFNGIFLDFSKNIINDSTLNLLIELAEARGLKQKIEAMFTGEKINITEDRSVLHTALRNRSNRPVYSEGRDVMPDINSVLGQMKDFCDRVHNGEWIGFNGDRITDVVNIGIGGSDLGPAMVCRALKAYAVNGVNVHFVSNVDSSDIAATLSKLRAESSLFVIASKTFTTQETISNAKTAREWFLDKCGGNKSFIEKHFVALSTNEKAVKDFGINPDNMFRFWDWVGGRYSLWSAIGLSIALYIGFGNFEKLLTGAYEMDMHFRETRFDKNIPVILALLGVWYINFFGYRSHAVIPYDHNLEQLPDFLQQLDMESNGKSVTVEGKNVGVSTGPVIIGKPGTNAQHSFFQLLHQGTQVIPADFIAAISGKYDSGKHRDILISNFLAQTEALMKGRNEPEVRVELKLPGVEDEEINKILPFRVFEGNRPTNTILIDELTPRNLGSIIAMYEHKVFVQGVIWNINSFDQWGVELGKQLAKSILPELGRDSAATGHDCSTNGLIDYFNSSK